MKLQLGPEIISSYKRLSYQPWFALAEFVDNSTQAYFNNRRTLNKAYAKEKTGLIVNISLRKDGKGNDFISIEDNSIGMSESELESAVVIGRPPANVSGRSRYGLGLKTGASWFGDRWTVETKKLGEKAKHKITINVPNIAKNRLILPHETQACDAGEHYTIIKIYKLHRHIAGRTIGKIKDYLRSLYRVDISKSRLSLRWNGEPLEWDSDINKRLFRLQNGKVAKKSFRFKIGKKSVSGWAGVLDKGSRKNAGFSIIQADRVITGWPDSYRPTTLYGGQEGGSNDLVNQRLMGEMYFKGFEVSHTKDLILYGGNDQELLDAKLEKELRGLRQLALTRTKNADGRIKEASEEQQEAALTKLQTELKSGKLKSFLKEYEIPASSLIRKSNEALKNSVVRRFKPDLKTKINKVTVSVYLIREMSPNDPYVIIQFTESDTAVLVILNVVHPHWAQLTKSESILNFIRHCTYDGVAEWKAHSETGKIEPDTVKLIKDNLLRIPMKIEDSQHAGN